MADGSWLEVKNGTPTAFLEAGRLGFGNIEACAPPKMADYFHTWLPEGQAKGRAALGLPFRLLGV
jgi:hypothetical protein